MEYKGDGESWEEYAHRLEKRIKEQREQLRAVQELRDEPRLRHRQHVAYLRRIIGRQTEQLARQYDGLHALKDAEKRRAEMAIELIEMKSKADTAHRIAKILMRRFAEMADLDPDSS